MAKRTLVLGCATGIGNAGARLLAARGDRLALGDVNAAVLGTDQELIDEIIAAGREVGEKFWQLPLDKEYSKQIRSDIADIKNVGGRKAGTITAAAFLKEFADGISWAHLDIAGTAWGDEAKP